MECSFSHEDLKSFWIFGFKISSLKFSEVAGLGKESFQAALNMYNFHQQGVFINPPVSQ